MQRGILRNVQWDVPLINVASHSLLDRAGSTFGSVATDAQCLYLPVQIFVIYYSSQFYMSRFH